MLLVLELDVAAREELERRPLRLPRLWPLRACSSGRSGR